MLSLNKISQFPLRRSTMALAWLLIEFRLSGSYNSSQSHALSPPSAISFSPHPNLQGKGERFYYSGDLLFTPPTLPVLSLFLHFAAHCATACVFGRYRSNRHADILAFQPQLIGVGDTFMSLASQPLQTGCQGAVLIMRDFEDVC